MKNPAVSNGVYLGLTLIAIALIMYFFYPTFFVIAWGFLVPLIFLVFYIGFMIKSGRELKRSQNGYALFGELLKVTFLTAAIGLVMYATYHYVLNNFIDPNFILFTKEEFIKRLSNNDSIDPEGLDQIERLMDEKLKVGLGTSLKNAFWGVVGNFFIALLVSLGMKNPKPALDNSTHA